MLTGRWSFENPSIGWYQPTAFKTKVMITYTNNWKTRSGQFMAWIIQAPSAVAGSIKTMINGEVILNSAHINAVVDPLSREIPGYTVIYTIKELPALNTKIMANISSASTTLLANLSNQTDTDTSLVPLQVGSRFTTADVNNGSVVVVPSNQGGKTTLTLTIADNAVPPSYWNTYSIPIYINAGPDGNYGNGTINISPLVSNAIVSSKTLNYTTAFPGASIYYVCDLIPPEVQLNISDTSLNIGDRFSAADVSSGNLRVGWMGDVEMPMNVSLGLTVADGMMNVSTVLEVQFKPLPPPVPSSTSTSTTSR